MGWNDDDVYYQPERFGLTVVGEMEWSEPCYDFDLTVLWKDKDGNLYWASDSGCSCPSPFEDFNSLEDLETGSKMDFVNYIQNRMSGVSYAQDYAMKSWAQLFEKLVHL